MKKKAHIIRMLTISFISIMTLGIVHVLAQDVTVNTKPIQFGTNYYEFVSSKNITWFDAKTAASRKSFKGVSGHLATISSARENEFLRNAFATGSSKAEGAWLGAKAPEGWRVGPESGQIFGYTHWGGIEPNNRGYVYMNIGAVFSGIGTGSWADDEDGNPSIGGFDPVVGYIVEYESGISPTPSPGLPDLTVVDFTTQLKGTGDKQYWHLRATIENNGDGDVEGKYLVSIKFSDKYESTENLKYLSFASTYQPPLRKGEKTSVEWRLNKSRGTKGTPFLPDGARALKVEVDPENRIEEADETNNSGMMLKVCNPINTELPEVAWVNSEKISIDEKAKAVLCYIKDQAAKNAKYNVKNVEKRTVAGSNFLDRLEKHYFNDYFSLADDSSQSWLRALGTEVVDKIGTSQIEAPTPPSSDESKFINILKFLFTNQRIIQRLPVPSAFRDKYNLKDERMPKNLEVPLNILKEINTPINPSTDLGSLISRKTVMDVPFLVGENNYASGAGDDWKKGGKNWSNVMHWATGVKYSHLPKQALQELFLGYEYWHMEGFDVFGEDAINDLIAEEQGRLFGKALRSGRIETRQDLIDRMDWAFRQSRAWVGAMLRLKNEQKKLRTEKSFDDWIIYAGFPKTYEWWSERGSVIGPWSNENGAKTIRGQLKSGKTINEVTGTPLVSRLIAIYELIYEADEWEKKYGKILLTPTIQKLLKGEYDDQFRAGQPWENPKFVWKP